ncbi:uncharacterized protein [Penaeus vannamei]|uniref:uncharacterized protein n=1 Tax=Penaeus vannamei TaxID=6689 RepID=UPI00387F681D
MDTLIQEPLLPVRSIPDALPVDPPVVSLNAKDVAIPVPDPPISEDSPNLTEIKEAICKLKDGKAAGNIPADLIKAGVEPMARGLHAVLAAIWQSGSIPSDQLRDSQPSANAPEQSGFTPGMSTIDCILVTVERRCEFDRGLLAAYIDLKKVFDSVHRE